MAMIKKLYCSNCDDLVDAQSKKKDEEYEVRGEKFFIDADIFLCPKCKEELFDEETDSMNLEKVYNLYRQKYNLLTPIQIKELREKYGLSQRAISRVLGWGEITYSRYENGAIQDSVHNEVLHLIKTPENMLEIYKKNRESLSLRTREMLEKKLNKLISDDAATNLILCFERYLSDDQSVNEYTGYKEFNLEKIKDTILYIISSSSIVLKTKLNKLLWYIDFLYFKIYSVSLTGCTYVHLPYGPIPNNYDDIINLMMHEGLLEKNEIMFNKKKGIVGEQLVPRVKIDKTKFSDDELNVINFVLAHFKDFSCGDITDYSHKEKPYKHTKDQDEVSYELAKDLSLELD